MERIETILAVLSSPLAALVVAAAVVVVVVQAIASTESATASSSLHGSKIMFDPTAMARMMTGGLDEARDLVYSGVAAAQSSSKSGSSSFSDFRAGRCVVRSARWVVMERRPRG